MTTLTEIESAASSLTAIEKQELMLFLAAQLRAEGAAPPEPRTFTREQVDVWIEQDEVDMRRLREQG